jgi:hypothetical protein
MTGGIRFAARDDMEFAVLQVALRTPMAIGRTGSAPVLDSLLLHRLTLMCNGDVDQAEASMPLARVLHPASDTAFWACGGCYVSRNRPPAGSAPAAEGEAIFYRKLARCPDLIWSIETMRGVRMGEQDPDEPHNKLGLNMDGVTQKMCGQLQEATQSTFTLVNGVRVDFRFYGDVDQVKRLMEVESFLGPGNASGLGEIQSVRVVDTDAIVSADDPARALRWMCSDSLGHLTRPVGAEVWPTLSLHGGLPRRHVRLDPPYWSERSPAVPGYVPAPYYA